MESSVRAMPRALGLVRSLHGRKRLSYLESATAVLARVDVDRYFEVIATYRERPAPQTGA